MKNLFLNFGSIIEIVCLFLFFQEREELNEKAENVGRMLARSDVADAGGQVI